MGYSSIHLPQEEMETLKKNHRPIFHLPYIICKLSVSVLFEDCINEKFTVCYHKCDKQR